MRKAVIDIGTNSVKLAAGESRAGKEPKLLFDINVITKLGEGLSGGRLSRAAIERTAEATAKFAQFARAHGAEEVLCVGTAALREARNAEEFAQVLHDAGGPDVRVISGEEEAELSSRAMLASIRGAEDGEVLIFDTGGGSTEFARAKDGKLTGAFSVRVGAVKLTEEHFSTSPADPHEVCAVVAEITKKFAAYGVARGAKMLIGAGGNVTAMAAVAAGMDRYDANKIHGSILKADEVARQTALYAECTDEERRRIRGLSPKRADIILGGACIITAAMEAAGAKQIVVSDRSLRHELLRRILM